MPLISSYKSEKPLCGTGVRDLAICRACRVVNTLRVGEAWVSPPVLEELRGREDIEILEGELTAFDDAGELLPFAGGAHR